MRRDLQGSQAAVRWAESKLPSLERRLTNWANRHVEIILREQELPAVHHLVVAREKKLLPFRFSVEAGAYLNTIRSSLDVLASALSARNGKTGNVEAHFPIYRSDLCMLDPMTGIERVKWLSDSQRTIIKSLEPYPGGNDTLVALHQLDIMRKHRRLLEVTTSPARVTFRNIRRQHVQFPAKMGIGANGETLLAFLSRDAPPGQIDATFYVAFSETGHYGEMPVASALRAFAILATNIIKKFN